MRPDTTAPYFPLSRGFSRVGGWFKLAYEYLVFFGGIALFGATCFLWSLIAALLHPLLPRKIGVPLGQFAIMAAFRWYLFMLKLSGIVHCDLAALDALRGQKQLIIAPNHPSLIDVVLIVSRLPRVACIMKAEIWDNIFLGGGARLAGYIRNDSPGNMIRLATAAASSDGGQLLVFPEGTRTCPEHGSPVNEFKGGFALIARTAHAPVQTVFIETNSRFLGKGWPLIRRPRFPLVYRAKLGQRFEVEGNVRTFVASLQDYYGQALAASTAAWRDTD